MDPCRFLATALEGNTWKESDDQATGLRLIGLADRHPVEIAVRNARLSHQYVALRSVRSSIDIRPSTNLYEDAFFDDRAPPDLFTSGKGLSHASMSMRTLFAYALYCQRRN